MKIDLESIKERNKKEEVYNVCKAFDDHLERGRREGKAEALKNLMKNLKVSLEQAMELLGIPVEDTEKYFPFG